MLEISDLKAMSTEELAQALVEAEARLEDVLEERRFTLGQTGVHLGAREWARLRRAWERDETRWREQMAAIQERLAAASAGAGSTSGPDGAADET